MRAVGMAGGMPCGGVARSVSLWMVGLSLPLIGQEDDIRGPKPMIEIPEPEPATLWLGYGLWALLGLVLVAAVIWFFKRRRAAEITAEEVARQELDQLGRSGGELEAGEFALAASQVVREFIQRKFGLAAPKRTTEEFLQELAGDDQRLLAERVDPLRGFLKSCDMAKFAGADLGNGERGELVAKARAFVDAPATDDGKEAA